MRPTRHRKHHAVPKLIVAAATSFAALAAVAALVITPAYTTTGINVLGEVNAS